MTCFPLLLWFDLTTQVRSSQVKLRHRTVSDLNSFLRPGEQQRRGRVMFRAQTEEKKYRRSVKSVVCCVLSVVTCRKFFLLRLAVVVWSSFCQLVLSLGFSTGFFSRRCRAQDRVYLAGSLKPYRTDGGCCFCCMHVFCLPLEGLSREGTGQEPSLVSLYSCREARLRVTLS